MLKDQLPSLLQTAENLKVKGLSETSSNIEHGNSTGDTSRYRTIPAIYSNYRRSIFNTNTPAKTISTQISSKPPSKSTFVTSSFTSSQNANERGNKRSSFDAKKDIIVNENSSRQLNIQKMPNSILRTSSPTSNMRSIVTSSITSSQNSGGTVTVSPTINNLKHSRDVSPVSTISIGGEPIKRKRGRPRTLDPDTDHFKPLHDTEEQDQQGM